VCFAVVSAAIRVRGAVWESREGFGFPGINSLSGLGSEGDGTGAGKADGGEGWISKPLDLLAVLGKIAGVAIGEGRAVVTVVDELSEVVVLELSARLTLVLAISK
jgi:hypothetical protein